MLFFDAWSEPGDMALKGAYWHWESLMCRIASRGTEKSRAEEVGHKEVGHKEAGRKAGRKKLSGKKPGRGKQGERDEQTEAEISAESKWNGRRM